MLNILQDVFTLCQQFWHLAVPRRPDKLLLFLFVFFEKQKKTRKGSWSQDNLISV